MDLHWDTSVGEKPLCMEGWLIGPIMVQKEFKPLLFLSSSLLEGSSIKRLLGRGQSQGQSSHRVVIKRESWGWMYCSGHSSKDNKIKWAVDLWRDYCTIL